MRWIQVAGICRGEIPHRALGLTAWSFWKLNFFLPADVYHSELILGNSTSAYMVHSSMPSWIGITWQTLNLYALIINTEQAFMKRRSWLQVFAWRLSHANDTCHNANFEMQFLKQIYLVASQLGLSHLAQSAKQIVSFWQALLGKLSFFRQKPIKNGFKTHKK